MRGIEQYLQVDAATLGALKYQGTWDASTNTPTLTSSVGVQGQYYVVSVAGSTNLNGETNWQVGDWAVFNGSVWQKVDGGSTGLLSTLTVTGNTYLATTSGNVGVGTTSPGYLLSVGDSTAPAGATITTSLISTDTTAGAVVGIRRSATVAAGVTINLLKSRGTAASPTAVASGDSIFLLSGSGYGGTNYSSLVGIQGLVDTYTSNTDISSYLVFSTTPAGSVTRAERMRITSTGDVGIGTTSPGAKLQVVGAGIFQLDGAGSTTPLVLRNNNTTSVQAVKLGFDSSGAIKSSINAAVYGNDYMTFNVGSDTERMRIDSSGNLGIGTSSPGAKLDVSGGDIRLATNATYYRSVTSGGTSVRMLGINAGNVAYIGPIDSGPTDAIFNASSTSTVAAFYTSGTEKMRLDSSGNLGLGGTPAAWGSTSRALGVAASTAAFVSGRTDAYRLHVGLNAYESASDVWRYTVGLAASRYTQIDGQHQWFNAPSGTAGNVASFTQAMTLDASGNLGIGTSSPGNKLHVTGSGDVARFTNGTNSAYFALDSAGFTLFTGATQTGNGLYAKASDNSLQFWTNSNSKMVIDSSGNVGIGTSSPGYRLDVYKAGAASVSAATSNTQSVLRAEITGNVALDLNAVSGYGELRTANNYPLLISTNGNERMRITAAGLVGIGITSPSTLLHVGKTSTDGVPAEVRVENAGATGSYGVFRAIAGTVEAAFYSDAAGNALGVAGATLRTISNNPFIFGTNNTERMRLDSSGNLLIGMTTAATSSAKTIHLANATVPTANPTGGGVLYVEGGALKYRGSSGTITTIANA